MFEAGASGPGFVAVARRWLIWSERFFGGITSRVGLDETDLLGVFAYLE